nr:putative integron gene cassette protein [uncultured bacterium]
MTMLRALKKWIEKRQYRRSANQVLRMLLGHLSRSNYEQLLAAYPGVESALDSAFERGDSPYEEAIAVVSSIFSNIIENEISLEDRQEIFDGIKARAENEQAPSSQPVVDSWVDVVIAVEGRAYEMVEAGLVEPEFREILMDESSVQ